MRSRFLLLASLALPAAARADDFDNRIGAGNLVFATPDGVKYEKAYAPFVTAALAPCVPASGPANLGKFIFVADVTRAGAVTNGAVRPATAVSQCFAAHLTQNRLPPPPLPSYAKINYPLVIELNLTP